MEGVQNSVSGGQFSQSDPDMDCLVCIFASGFDQVPVMIKEKHATDFTIIAAHVDMKIITGHPPQGINKYI